MVSVKDTDLYKEVLKEFNYSFGNIFVFRKYVISEINEGVIINWKDHAKVLVNDVSGFLGVKVSDLILISNRINSYSTIASDWLKFFKDNDRLKAYIIVSDEKAMLLGAMIENLFFNGEIKMFNSLYEAVNYVENGSL